VVSEDTLSILRIACMNAYLSGALVVASSGNLRYACCDPMGNTFEVPYVTFPVAFSRRVLGVGGVTAVFPPGPRRWADKTIWPDHCQSQYPSCQGSNFWHEIYTSGVEPFVDLVAPGGRFIVTTAQGPNSYYDLANCDFNTTPGGDLGFGGTSASAPLVSGAAALLLSRFGYLLGDELEHVLRVTASLQGFNQPISSNEYGWGMVKPDSAIKYLSSPRVLTRGLVAGSALPVLDSLTNVLMYFENVPGVPSSGIASTRYRLGGKVDFKFYTSTPDAWVRGSGSAGASDSNHYNAFVVVPWGRVFQVSQASCSLETFVYRTDYGWVPTDPSRAAIAWSAVGPTNVVGVEPGRARRELALQAAPNPVAASARISLDLPERGRTNISVIDLAGRVVARIVTGVLDGGRHEFKWDGRDVRGRACPAGVYFVRAEHRGRGLTKRLVLLQGGRP
jgi:hypothetical protein